jgi:hypothetical protein
MISTSSTRPMGDPRKSTIAQIIGRDLTFRAHRVPPSSANMGRPLVGSPARQETRLPWVQATGTPETQTKKAAHYLLGFDYDKVAETTLDTEILAKVVCNLRNYYMQDADQTVALIAGIFNLKFTEPRHPDPWSPEAIRLTWELVEPYTPSLGLADVRAVAMLRAIHLERVVRLFIEGAVLGGRISGPDLYTAFRKWDPSSKDTLNAFTRAVQNITGLKQKPSNGTYYWMGFHIPTLSIANLGKPMAA